MKEYHRSGHLLNIIRASSYNTYEVEYVISNTLHGIDIIINESVTYSSQEMKLIIANVSILKSHYFSREMTHWNNYYPLLEVCWYVDNSRGITYYLYFIDVSTLVKRLIERIVSRLNCSIIKLMAMLFNNI